LKPFSSLHQLLRDLQTLPNPTIVYCPDLDPQSRQQFAASHLSFASQPVDISQVAEQCDLAILHGTLGTATAMLLAGKPSLQIPILVEQGLAAMAIARLGAGLMALPSAPDQIRLSLRQLLVDDRYLSAARAFAKRHSDYRPGVAIQKLVDRAEQLATQPSKST
jgi:UDP:flavonoid glycosyltransferase YjiC (YdhE family)